MRPTSWYSCHCIISSPMNVSWTLWQLLLTNRMWPNSLILRGDHKKTSFCLAHIHLQPSSCRKQAAMLQVTLRWGYAARHGDVQSHRELKVANICVCELGSDPVRPANICMSELRSRFTAVEPQEYHSLASPEPEDPAKMHLDLYPSNCKIINLYFKPLSFRGICYAAMNMHM